MAAADGGAIEFRVLGTVEVCRNGTTLALGGPRQRAVLALLLLEPGRPVSAERFADELWHGEPPPGSSTTVRAYVSRLRSALGDGASITSAAAGYVLDVAPERVDARCFERLLREGEDALARGVVGRAAERLRAALELWRGEPFGELGVEGTLGLEARRLVELRLLAIEKRIDADLALGNDPELVAELEALVEEHPFRESLWRQLMVGELSWWNPLLNGGLGGWEPAAAGVPYTINFIATGANRKTEPGAFGIRIVYTPVPPQPVMLPNSGPQPLRGGAVSAS